MGGAIFYFSTTLPNENQIIDGGGDEIEPEPEPETDPEPKSELFQILQRLEEHQPEAIALAEDIKIAIQRKCPTGADVDVGEGVMTSLPAPPGAGHGLPFWNRREDWIKEQMDYFIEEITKGMETVRCPGIDCENWMYIPDKADPREIRCPGCGISFCSKCKALWHGEDITCDEAVTLSDKWVEFQRLRIFMPEIHDPVSYTHLTLPTSDLV